MKKKTCISCLPHWLILLTLFVVGVLLFFSALLLDSSKDRDLVADYVPATNNLNE